MKRSILVTGASIAGPALAYWLRRYGMDVVVVERAPELRDGGQTIDIRGASKTVVKRMGIEAAIRADTTHEEGIAFVDEMNRFRAAISAEAFEGEGFVAEIEILRGELAKILVEHTRADVDYVFGDRISAINDDGDKVHVTFQNGAPRTFDLVIIAEGINSSTRKMVFGDEVKFRSFGLYTAYFTIPREPSDGAWARWFNSPGSLSVMLRPDNLGTTRALMSFQGPQRGYEKLPQAEQKALLKEKFAHVGWEAPRVLRALDHTPDFYFESIGQIKMSHWSKGRIALLGDAGYCASPISGMGTALALVGAYVLGGELMRNDDHRKAFAAYEAIMRPYVDQAQDVWQYSPRLASPRTRAGIAIGRAVLRLASVPVIQQLTRKFFTTRSDAITLPDYDSAPS